ncbi:MAG: carboxypeptidase regulatory-like domain-containing protein [Candidatus Anstonellales archaeon]
MKGRSFGWISSFLVFIFLVCFSFGYEPTSFSFVVGGVVNVNSTFFLDIVANNSNYVGGCSDRVNANSSRVLVNSSGNFIALSDYNISERYNASGISGTARLQIKISALGIYNISLNTTGCENVSPYTSTTISLYGGRFFGYVWNGSIGNPFLGAEVKLSGNYGNETAFTDSDGYYQFFDVVPSNGYMISANASGYESNQSWNLTLVENESKSINFTLKRISGEDVTNGSLFGFVLNSSSGYGIGGANLKMDNSTLNITLKTNTSQNGSYSFFNMMPGLYLLSVTATEFEGHSRIVLIVGGYNYLNITLNESKGGRIFGYVRNVSNNASVPDALIRISKNRYLVTKNTGSNGYYYFDNLTAGNYTLLVNATKFISRTLYFELKNSSSAVELNISLFTISLSNLSNGVSCENDDQCASGNCCNRVCTALDCNVSAGGTCRESVECEAGLSCCYGTCQLPPCIQLNVPEGGACNKTYQCIRGLVCCGGFCKSGECVEDVEVEVEKTEVIVLGFERIGVKRKVISNKSMQRSEVSLNIINIEEEAIYNVELWETVPSNVAGVGISEIEPKEHYILNGSGGSKIIIWRFSVLEPQKEISIRYKINKFVDDASGFSSFGKRYETVTPEKIKIARLIAPARINVGKQVTLALKDIDGTPIPNVGIIISAPNGQNMILISNDDGMVKYVASIEGEYTYSVEGWQLIESVRKTMSVKEYVEHINISSGIKVGQIQLNASEIFSFGLAGLVLVFIAAGIVLVLIILFYYIYLKKK